MMPRDQLDAIFNEMDDDGNDGIGIEEFAAAANEMSDEQGEVMLSVCLSLSFSCYLYQPWRDR